MNFGRWTQGSVLMAVSAFAWVIGLLLFAQGIHEAVKRQALRSEGLLVTARVVTARIDRRQGSFTRFGRSVVPTPVVEVAFAKRDGRPFRDEAPAAPRDGAALLERLFPSRANESGTRSTPDTRATLVSVRDARFARLPLGATVPVVFLPDEPDFVLDAQTLRDEAPWTRPLPGAFFLALGGTLSFVGLRRRRS